MRSQTKWIIIGLVALWAVLYLPHLRTSPNWYGDEGEWMEKCWTFIHGEPRVGPIINDFIFPYPYPPLYMLVTGSLLRVFGNDIVVARVVGALLALGSAGLLVWIGTRLRNHTYGIVSAIAFLVYSESIVNFRWVRSHPMAGMIALACVGFLIRYLQERRWHDLIWAGAMCALATATNYFTYPLVGVVAATVVIGELTEGEGTFRSRWPRALGRGAAVGAIACAYVVGFVLWYTLAQPGGWPQLMAQVHRLTSVADNELRPTLGGEIGRFVTNIRMLGFQSPTQGPPPAWGGHDIWLMIATVGLVFIPSKNWRFRLWVPLFVLALMFGVFRKLNNIPMFFYPATVFLPLMALGFGGVLVWAGEAIRWLESRRSNQGTSFALAPAIVVLVLFGIPSVTAALSGFKTKIDLWTQWSVPEAQAAMRYVNDHTTRDDFVIVPKQIYWLVKDAKKSMLSHGWSYLGRTNGAWPIPIPKERFWFDCQWQNAKYVVLASGIDERSKQPRGIDVIYTISLEGMAGIVSGMVREQWPVVFAGGSGVAHAPIGQGTSWPLALNGEYLVLANPRLVKPAER